MNNIHDTVINQLFVFANFCWNEFINPIPYLIAIYVENDAGQNQLASKKTVCGVPFPHANYLIPSS